jgi:dTDP-4-dehydrorhamnose reductase
MKLFLTGASGLVGGTFAQLAAAHGHQVIGIVGRFTGELPGLAQRLSLDLTDANTLTSALRAAAPDAIVNCAAISEPAQCDADPIRSEAMNVALPALLARFAREHNLRVLHLSSEQVFDGARTTPYAPSDAAHPINLYGRQKLASEHAVLAAAPQNSAVVRAPLLIGNSPSRTRSVHERLLADWRAGRTPRLYTDEFRQPCTADNLSAALLELLSRPDLCGVFHWAGAELLSRYELGERIRAHFNLSATEAPLAAVTRADTPRVSLSRPPCLALDLNPLARALRTPPQTLAQQLPVLRA